MLTTFIFDIGGVLVKNDEALLDAIFLSLKRNGLNPTDRETTFRAFGQSNRINVETAVRTCYSESDIDEVIDRCFHTFEKIFPSEVLSGFSLFPGNRDVLELLQKKRLKLGVFTGLNRIEGHASLDAVGIKDFFSVIVTFDDVAKPRPDPAGVLKAVELLQAKPSECIYVGDTVADIRMARNAKIKCVCVKTGVQSNNLLAAENPDYFVEDLTEMVEVLGLK